MVAHACVATLIIAVAGADLVDVRRLYALEGLGLVGIRERVKIYGGEMSSGTGTDGGFVLTARLPLGAIRS